MSSTPRNYVRFHIFTTCMFYIYVTFSVIYIYKTEWIKGFTPHLEHLILSSITTILSSRDLEKQNGI